MPHLGSQSQPNNRLKQALTGVKEHGVGVFLYRTINNVTKGADLTIFCILAQLERYKIRNDCYPEELYVQVDGGSENANKYCLAAMELIVAKRMVRVIHYTRLPTGHTHEDIDACFGHIKKILKGKKTKCMHMYINTYTHAYIYI